MLTTLAQICLAVASASLRLYRLASTDEQFTRDVLRKWDRIGQMKVVVKAQSSQELRQLYSVALTVPQIKAMCMHAEESCLLPAVDVKWKRNWLKEKKKEAEEKENEESGELKNESGELTKESGEPPLVLMALIGDSELLDTVTGHLKLL